MEDSFIKITLLNSINVISSLPYGATNIEYDNEKTREEVGLIIETVNAISGKYVLYEDRFVESDPEVVEHEGSKPKIKWNEKNVSGRYKLIYGDRHNPVPKINEDDLNVWNKIKEAAENKEICRLEVNPAMHKAIKRKCAELGVRFKGFGQFVTIDGQEKELSVYKKIQKAFSDGASSVSFDLNEISMPTVRTYASQFGSAVNQKVRCSVKDGMITVHFKEGLESEIKHLWDTYITTEGEDVVRAAFAAAAGENGVNFDPVTHISKNPIESIDIALEELAWDDKITPEAYNEIKRLLAHGTIHGMVKDIVPQESLMENPKTTFPRPLPSVTVTTGNSENAAIKAAETAPAAVGDGDSSDPVWEEVDGMKQIIIPGLRAAGPKKMPEDDDF